MQPLVSHSSAILALSSATFPPRTHNVTQESYEIGCPTALCEAFKRMVSSAQRARPQLPVLVVSGLPGSCKTTTTAALTRYLEHSGIEHQSIPLDMFISPNSKRHLSFGACALASNAGLALASGPVRCAIGRQSLRILHDFNRIDDLISHLSSMTRPLTIQASMPKYGTRELVPGRFTIIEGFAASMMVGRLSGAQHCFIDSSMEISKTRYLLRHADEPSQRNRARVRSMFLHSPLMHDVVNSQKSVAHFIVRYKEEFDTRNFLQPARS